jgi:hypothetical protein
MAACMFLRPRVVLRLNARKPIIVANFKKHFTFDLSVEVKGANVDHRKFHGALTNFKPRAEFVSAACHPRILRV